VSDAQTLAESVVARMRGGDAFTRALGMELVEVAPRRAVLRMAVRADMVNGFGICHGGATFALADSALAFASNAHGSVTVSIENSIGYAAAAHVGDVLTARCEAESTGRRVSFYRVAVVNQNGEPVAHFRGTVYDTGKPHQ
jgi:acyl-CoA thioesterase